MNKETIAMIKQILEAEESLDQLREKENYEKNQRFPKEKPLKPEREQVVRRYKPVLSQLEPDYTKWCRPLIVTGVLFIAAMILSAIPPLSIFMALLVFADIFLIGASAIYIIYCRVVIFPKEKKADEERIRNSREYKEEANSYADEMNELQREANETAAKARRDMNIANAANIYQNHKRNKMLDRMNKK